MYFGSGEGAIFHLDIRAALRQTYLHGAENTLGGHANPIDLAFIFAHFPGIIHAILPGARAMYREKS
jgi:hypothetical protein